MTVSAAEAQGTAAMVVHTPKLFVMKKHLICFGKRSLIVQKLLMFNSLNSFEKEGYRKGSMMESRSKSITLNKNSSIMKH